MAQWVHFVGIGGVGMSGIARILLTRGYRVSGSDLQPSETLTRLEQEGATVYSSHDATNLDPGVDLVVISSAIPDSNPELVKARELHLNVIKRGEMLARLMRENRGIAVAGAHGKTTTSAMISLVLELNGLDPTIVVGGDITNIGVNSKPGRGEYLVAEADESDGSFLLLDPEFAVVTNIEDDHLDHYGTIDNIYRAFEEFVAKLPVGGIAILCWDDPQVRRLGTSCGKRVLTYGFNSGARLQARNIRVEGLKSFSEIVFDDKKMGLLELGVPGEYNVSNALATIAVGLELGLEFAAITAVLKDFRGVKRRFQLLGQADGIAVYDDYAHHPTEVKAVLQAARQATDGRLIAVFQPHRFTRTLHLYREFGQAFGDADLIIIDDIYPAGERPIPGVTSGLIVEAARQSGHQSVVHLAGRDSIVDFLAQQVRPGDLILTVGAGNVWQAGIELAARLVNGA